MSTLQLLVAIALALPAEARPPPAEAAGGGRVIVLGFDGYDARMAERLMDAGQLPNLARLRESGTYAPLATTVPAESPVSWAALNCGQNPAETGISGFIERELAPGRGPRPALGHVTHESRAVSELDPPLLERALVAWSPWTLAVLAFAAVAAAFWILFALLLQIRARVAIPMSMVLGVVGAAGARVASGYVPRAIDDVVGNPLATAPFWEHAARAGVPCVVLDGAMAWDRAEVPGARVLAGLGVPDVRGSNGDWFLYTTDPTVIERAPKGRPTSTGGRLLRVDERDGRIESRVYGPLDFVGIDAALREAEEAEQRLGRPGLAPAEALALRERARALKDEVLPRLRNSEEGRLSLPLVVERTPDGARVTIGGQQQAIAAGAWSRWYRLTFELSPLVKVRAVTRCKLVSLDEPFELFVDFLQHDPEHACWWQPVSQPPGFAAELARAAGGPGGPYDTVGWACLTMPFKDREIDARTFVEDLESTYLARAKLLRATLAQDDWRALFFVESTPDRAQHMLWRFGDPSHPGHDAAAAAERVTYLGREMAVSEVIDASYRASDDLVGEVLAQLRPDDTLLVCSDHGFQPFRRQVHLNSWLAQAGYLALRPGVTRADVRSLAFVDWPRTKAYALGLGGIWLNLRGREPSGIVDPADAPTVLAQIRGGLLALEDDGARAVRDVYLPRELQRGPHEAEQADLMLGFAAGWRVSWATTLGDIALVEAEDGVGFVPAAVFEDNKQNWSGDHVSVARDLVTGVFYSSRKLALPAEGIDLLHVAPTALALLGVPVPPECDRAPLAP